MACQIPGDVVTALLQNRVVICPSAEMAEECGRWLQNETGEPLRKLQFSSDWEIEFKETSKKSSKAEFEAWQENLDAEDVDMLQRGRRFADHERCQSGNVTEADAMLEYGPSAGHKTYAFDTIQSTPVTDHHI